MDEPLVTLRQEVNAKGEASFIVDLTVETRCPGSLLLAVDLSDSSPVTEADVARLPRLLTPLPRNWRVTITGLGTAVAEAASRYVASTVGDVVDGAVDLRSIAFDAAVLSRERTAGSFLSHIVHKFLAAAEPGDARLVAIVLTDGKLVDVDPVCVPEKLRVLGLAPDQGATDRARWSELVPGAPLISRDTERDAIGKLRAAAGCAFHGPCVVEIPKGEYQVRLADGSTTGDTPRVSLSRWTWDFSLREHLVLEFVGLSPPDHLIVEGTDGVQARVPLPKPSEAGPAKTARGQSPEPTADSDIISVSLGTDELTDLLQTARELAESRSAWQTPDGELVLAPPGSILASHLFDDNGRPRADFYLLVAREQPAASKSNESGDLLLIPLRRNSQIHFLPGAANPYFSSFAGGTSWSIHFDKLENRWMYAAINASVVPLPPRGSHALPVDMRDAEGRPGRVFFAALFDRTDKQK